MSKEYTIRVMTLEDYDEVYALWMGIHGFGIRSIDDSKEGVERFLKRNPTTSMVAVADGKIDPARSQELKDACDPPAKDRTDHTSACGQSQGFPAESVYPKFPGIPHHSRPHTGIPAGIFHVPVFPENFPTRRQTPPYPPVLPETSLFLPQQRPVLFFVLSPFSSAVTDVSSADLHCL